MPRQERESIRFVQKRFEMAQLTPEDLNKKLQDAQLMTRMGTILGISLLPIFVSGFFVEVNPGLDPGRFAVLYVLIYGAQIMSVVYLGKVISMIQTGLEETRIATDVSRARGWNLKGLPLHKKIETNRQ